MYTEILRLLRQITPLEKSEETLITESFRTLTLSKGDYFLKAGEISKHIGYLNKGLVRYFVFKDDEESTFEFTKEGEFIADYQSFNKKCISVQNIQAIEDCELLVLDYPALQTIFNTTKNGNLIGRLIIEHRFDIMVTQLLAIYMQTPSSRYQKFMEDYALLAQRIPQYLIASYVGVKPQSLSRIRRRFARGIS